MNWMFVMGAIIFTKCEMKGSTFGAHVAKNKQPGHTDIAC